MIRLGLCGWRAELLRAVIPVIAVAVAGCTGGSSDEFTGTTLDYELAATTVVVDENASASVVSVGEDGSIVVEPGSDLGGQVSAGTVLLFQRSDVTPNGLLRKVTFVSADGDRIVLATEQATLEDAFDEFHLVMNEAVESSSSALQMRSAIPGVTHKRIGGSGSVTYTDKVDFDKTVLYDDDGNKKTTGDQVVLDGSLSFSFGIRMEVDIGWGGLKEFAYTPVLKQKAEVEVSTTLAKWSEEEEIVVATFAVPFTAWVVPMLFNLDIVIGAEGRLEARLSTGMSLEASADSGVLYKDGKWSLTGGTRVDCDYDPPTLDASASLKGYVGLRGELLICGVVGPELTIDGYLELSADINEDPWWELVAGLEGFVGIKGEILGAVLFEFESDDFIKQKVTLADAGGPFGSSTCIPDCGTRECGLDPVCGARNCGTCDDGYSCQDGECVEGACVPDCGAAKCGLDPVCGTQNCGTCDDGYSCQVGECVQGACVRDCTGLVCGPDPICGQSCGTCDDGYLCQSGKCVLSGCIPDCGQRLCGPDPLCGQSCGLCADDESCTEWGQCKPVEVYWWTDATTGLTWENPPRYSVNQGVSNPWTTWEWARDYCLSLDYLDYSWRLPTIRELRSLIRGCASTVSEGSCGVKEECFRSTCRDASCVGCASDSGPADGCYWPDGLEGDCSYSSMCYWTSDWVVGCPNGSCIWCVYFDTGNIGWALGSDVQLVRCVTDNS